MNHICVCSFSNLQFKKRHDVVIARGWLTVLMQPDHVGLVPEGTFNLWSELYNSATCIRVSLIIPHLSFPLLLPITSVMVSFVFISFLHLPVPPPPPSAHFATLPHPPSWSSRSFFPPFIPHPPTSSSISPSALLHLPLTFQLDVSAPPGTSGGKMDEGHSGFFSSRLFISFPVCFKFHLN